MEDLSNAGRFAVARADKLLSRLVSQVKRTLESPDTDQVHDLRVAIRRFTQVLIVFKRCFPGKEVKRVRKTLKKTMALAGDVRDLDIASDLAGESKLHEASIFRVEFKAERKAAARFLTEKLQRSTKRRVFSKWRHKLTAATPDAAGAIEDIASQTLPRLANRLFAVGKTANRGPNQIAQLHQLRIEAKKFRYALELFAPLRAQALRAPIGQIKKLQNILGGIHDLEIVRAKVCEQAAGKKFAAELEKSRDQQIEEFRSYWTKEFAGAENLARWRKRLNVFHSARRVAGKPPERSESRASASRPAKSA